MVDFPASHASGNTWHHGYCKFTIPFAGSFENRILVGLGEGISGVKHGVCILGISVAIIVAAEVRDPIIQSHRRTPWDASLFAAWRHRWLDTKPSWGSLKRLKPIRGWMCFKGGVLGISTGFVSELLGSDMKTLEKIGGYLPWNWQLAPENGWLEDYSFLLDGFMAGVSFREGILPLKNPTNICIKKTPQSKAARQHFSSYFFVRGPKLWEKTVVFNREDFFEIFKKKKLGQKKQ